MDSATVCADAVPLNLSGATESSEASSITLQLDTGQTPKKPEHWLQLDLQQGEQLALEERLLNQRQLLSQHF